MVMDCGPLNRCGALYIGFMLVLVEVGFYDIGVLVFLQVSQLAVRVVKTRPSNAGPNYRSRAVVWTGFSPKPHHPPSSITRRRSATVFLA